MNNNHAHNSTNIPRIPLPLPTTANFNTVISIIETHAPARLQPLARGLTWVRDRLDPFHLLEQAEAKQKEEEEEGDTSDEEMEMEGVAMSSAKRWSRGDKEKGIVPRQNRTSGEEKNAGLELVPVTLSTIFKGRSSLEILESANTSTLSQQSRKGGMIHQQPSNRNVDDAQKQRQRERKTSKPGRTGETGRSRQQSTSVGVMENQSSKKTLDLSQAKRKLPSEQNDGTRTSSRQPDAMDPNLSDACLDPSQGQRQDRNLPEPEHMEVPTVYEVHTLDSKVKPYPQEQARLTKDLAEALSTNNFKVWPILPPLTTNLSPSSSTETSPEYHKPLEKQEQARKEEITEEWMMKEERSIEGRRRWRGKAGYDDEVERRFLRSTEMFVPTLAPFGKSGEGIPTREEMWEMVEKEDDNTSGSGTSGEYVDALESLDRANKPRDDQIMIKEKIKGETLESVDKKQVHSRVPRRPTFKKEAVHGLDRAAKHKDGVMGVKKKEMANSKKMEASLQLSPELSDEEMPKTQNKQDFTAAKPANIWTGRRPALQYIDDDSKDTSIAPTKKERAETIPRGKKDREKEKPQKKLKTSSQPSREMSKTRERREMEDTSSKPRVIRRPTLQYIDRDSEEMSLKKDLVTSLNKARTKSQVVKAKEKAKNMQKQLETLPLASKDKNKPMTQTTHDNVDSMPAKPQRIRRPTLQPINSDSEGPAFALSKPKPQ